MRDIRKSLMYVKPCSLLDTFLWFNSVTIRSMAMLFSYRNVVIINKKMGFYLSYYAYDT